MGCPIPAASPVPGLCSLPEPRVGSALPGAVATCPAALPLAFLPPRLAPPALRLPSRPGEARPGPAQPRFTREELLGCPRAGTASGSSCEQAGCGMGLRGSGARAGLGDFCTTARGAGTDVGGARAALGGCSTSCWGAAPRAQGRLGRGLRIKCQPGRGCRVQCHRAWGAGGCSASQEGTVGCSARARASGVQCQQGRGAMGAVPARQGLWGPLSAAQEGRQKQRTDSSHGDNPWQPPTPQPLTQGCWATPQHTELPFLKAPGRGI